MRRAFWPSKHIHYRKAWRGRKEDPWSGSGGILFLSDLWEPKGGNIERQIW